jgi:Rha family phage regulatory protein
MNDLVILVGGVPMVDSVLVAKKFVKVHRDVLRAIKNLDCSKDFWMRNFAQSSYEVRGKEYESYNMTRDGFTFLCMGFTGKEAARWKEAYINAFNAMERSLAKKDDAIEWKQARLQIKQVRKNFTDTVSDFVKYATEQGSKSANMYYCNITKMEYAALELIEKGQKAPENFRDTLDVMDLGFLQTAEQVARAALLNGMERKLPYKEIYQLAKDKVYAYAETISFARIENNGR